MNKQEFRAASSLAAVFSVRLLGLFMIYPVFAAYAGHLSGSTPFKIGLALGIYGLSQGLLQIPFGILSDRVGRKVMIILGLMIFAIGSAVAASSTSIEGVIIGRVLQGSGAVGSVILAFVADLTREENRTKAMAMVGVTIGVAFNDRSCGRACPRRPGRRAGHLLADGGTGLAWHSDDAIRRA